MTDYKYRYFVSFSYTAKNHSGFGNMEHQTNNEIKNIQNVMSLTDEMKDILGVEEMTIINFTLFED